MSNFYYKKNHSEDALSSLASRKSLGQATSGSEGQLFQVSPFVSVPSFNTSQKNTEENVAAEAEAALADSSSGNNLSRAITPNLYPLDSATAVTSSTRDPAVGGLMINTGTTGQDNNTTSTSGNMMPITSSVSPVNNKLPLKSSLRKNQSK